MAGLKLRTSGVGSDRSTNLCTTTAKNCSIYCYVRLAFRNVFRKVDIKFCKKLFIELLFCCRRRHHLLRLFCVTFSSEKCSNISVALRQRFKRRRFNVLNDAVFVSVEIIRHQAKNGSNQLLQLITRGCHEAGEP